MTLLCFFAEFILQIEMRIFGISRRFLVIALMIQRRFINLENMYSYVFLYMYKSVYCTSTFFATNLFFDFSDRVRQLIFAIKL